MPQSIPHAPGDTIEKKREHMRRAQRIRVAERKARGVCIACNGRPAVTVNYCEICASRIQAVAKAAYKRSVADGLCGKCKRAPLVEGHQECATCLQVKRERLRANKKRWQAAGLCRRCGKSPLTSGDYRCEACLAKKNDQYRREREKMLDAYGRVCACCGETETRFLTLDHLNDDGHEHRRKVGKRGVLRSVRLQGYPKDAYALMCYNCNCGRANNNGICPHKIADTGD